MAKQTSHFDSSTALAQCQRYGHILRSTFTVGERLCTRCGKKVYCPTCTSHVPQNATRAYCMQHDPTEIALAQAERQVRS